LEAGLAAFLNNAILGAFQFYSSIRSLAVRLGRADIVEGIYGAPKRLFKFWQKSSQPLAGTWGQPLGPPSLEQGGVLPVRRRDEFIPKMQLTVHLFLLPRFATGGAVADVRPHRSAGFSQSGAQRAQNVVIRRANLDATPVETF